MSSPLQDKSKAFALQIIKVCNTIKTTKKESVLTNQLIRSGTSVGANIREALRSSSRKEFVAKMNISLKEAYETEYWLELLYKTDYISEKEYNSIFPQCRELTNILSQIILTTKANTR